MPIPKGSLIYCDIPYKGTNCGKYKGFDHERFYEWARKQDNIYISEYSMPDDFIPYSWNDKTILSASNGNSSGGREVIFTNERTFSRLSEDQKELSKRKFATQLDIFGLLQVGAEDIV